MQSKQTGQYWGRLLLSSVVFIFLAQATSSAWASSHTGNLPDIPLQDTPGALMQRNQYYFELQETAPFLFEPFPTEIEQETGYPIPDEPDILVLPGVIPQGEPPSGIRRAPNGDVYIVPMWF